MEGEGLGFVVKLWYGIMEDVGVIFSKLFEEEEQRNGKLASSKSAQRACFSPGTND